MRADGQKEQGFRWTCNHCEDVVVGDRDASRRIKRPVICDLVRLGLGLATSLPPHGCRLRRGACLVL